MVTVAVRSLVYLAVFLAAIAVGQLLVPNHALVKSHGGERCGNVGTMIPAGTVERGERKRTVDEVSKAD
jgi:hypothetical protein